MLGRRMLAVVFVFAVAAATTDYNTRMTPEEREKVFESLQERYRKIEPACKPPEHPPDNPKPLPPAPDSFTTKVEIAYQEEKKMKVIYGAESFDGVFNTGVLKYELGENVILSRPHLREEIIHFSKPADEAIFIVTDDACSDEGNEHCDLKRTCHADNMEAVGVELQELFGFGDVNGDSGYFGASGILHWGANYGYNDVGAISCRGLRCAKYETCITDPNENATISITYYWSDPTWMVATNGKQVPIAIEVYATGKFGHLFQRKVMQRYDFYEFYSGVRPDLDELEPPVDVYCKKRTSVIDPPTVPHYFAYNSELVTGFDVSFPIGNNESTKVQFTSAISQQEFYDWDAKIVTADYVPWFAFGEQNRYEYKTKRIQDFVQGIVYRIREHVDGCRVSRIENFTNIGDVVVGDDGSVSMLPPWIYANSDEPMQYNGWHWTRGVEADTWIGEKRIKPTLFHETYVWYYATMMMNDQSELSASDKGSRKNTLPTIISPDENPIRFEKYTNMFAKYPHTIYNIYNYQSEPPMTHIIDISSCYTASQMRSFVFSIPSNSLMKVHFLRDKLKYATQAALAEIGVVSALRINRLVLDETDSENLRILFTILDLPTVEGDAPGSQLDSDLTTAVSLIDTAIANSRIVIVVPLKPIALHPEEPVPVYIIPIPGSFMEVTRDNANNYVYETSKGYKPGDMAGLAIGMLLVGGLIAVAAFMVLNKQGGGGGLPRVSMARKSKVPPETSIDINADLTSSDS